MYFSTFVFGMFQICFEHSGKPANQINNCYLVELRVLDVLVVLVVVLDVLWNKRVNHILLGRFVWVGAADRPACSRLIQSGAILADKVVEALRLPLLFSQLHFRFCKYPGQAFHSQPSQTGTFARTEAFAGHFHGAVVDAIVIVHTAERAVGAIVCTAQENWLHHWTWTAPAEDL